MERRRERDERHHEVRERRGDEVGGVGRDRAVEGRAARAWGRGDEDGVLDFHILIPWEERLVDKPEDL